MHALWLLAIACALALAGCFDLPAVFSCSDDNQCDTGDPHAAGFCEPEAFCSQEDSSCPSGRRFAHFSGDGLADVCVPPRDASVGDFAGSDGSRGDLALPDLGMPTADLEVPDAMRDLMPPPPDMTYTCPKPRLLVAVQDLTNNAGSHGSVLRFSLAGGGTPVRCSDVNPAGIGAVLTTVAPIPPNLIAVGSSSTTDKGLQVIDPIQNAIVGSNNVYTSTNSLDIAPIKDVAGNQLIAVGESMPASDGVDVVEVFRLDGTVVDHWYTNGDFGLGSPYGMTASQFDPRHLWMPNVSVSSYAAYEVDPWTQAKTPYINDTLPDRLSAIYAITVGTTHRISWVGQQGGTLAYEGAFYKDDSSATVPGSPIGTPAGPVACVGGTVPSCDIVHVVPDPTASSAQLLGLCDDTVQSDVRARFLIRFTGASCTSFFDGTTLDAQTRMWRLAVEQ
jgi:hypothetical protein